MKIAIHQPQFMPWLGYFDKMDKVDIFVLLDNVQFKKNEFQNRNKIKTSHDQWQWLTVPVSFNFGDKIKEVKINNNDAWQNKHLKTLKTNYSKAGFFKEITPGFEKLYSLTYQFLASLNQENILLIKDLFCIKTQIALAGTLPEFSPEPTERLLDICKYYKADTYLAGEGGRNYMDCDKFTQAGVKLEFQHFVHPKYQQLFGKFEPYMSALDYLLNCGQNFNPIRELNKV